ncbi:hypothetical protein IH981_04265 [Patescibacteria group bacterium]|nr:hypothetical protein [Patescibacteria group bacterium]
MKSPNWIKIAYKNTSVNWAKTQTEMYKKLNELGIYDIRFTNLKDQFALEFLVQVNEGEKPRAVRIVVPLKYHGEDEKKRLPELNIIHRVLLNHLKAKFIAISLGLTEFEKEFMAHLIITDKHGNSTTMGEAILPQYQKNLESGENKDFKLLGGGN